MRSSRKIFRRLLFAATVPTLLLAAFGAAWFAAPYFADDPMTELRRRTPVRVWFDRTGRTLYCERTWNHQWRFPVSSETLPEHLTAQLLAAEDASFHRHSGVDYAAALRALTQNCFSGKVISGASTISMQLAGLAMPPGKRSIGRKWKQAAMARKLEMLHTKEEILEEYLNRIPFGGSIYGIEAAARYYFGIHAEQLNPAESALLCGLPQKPNRYRPDRHSDAARKRQKRILGMLAARGGLTSAEAERIWREEPLRLRDFRLPSAFARHAAPEEFRFALRETPRADDEFTVRVTIDAELQSRVLELLRAQCGRLPDVRDAAALLLDNRTGEILVWIGSLDWNEPNAGQVDAVRAVRSAGSALKPFLYLEAVNAGRLVAATFLDDVPLRSGTYAPGNYDGRFHGRVTASFALSHSLNTPAVRLAAQLGPRRILASFHRLGLTHPNPEKDRDPGLSLALGTVGHTLHDMTAAYAVLASEGRAVTPHLRLNASVPRPEAASVSPYSCRMISQMLRTLPLPRTTLDVAWKTGTSNNNCDAWCFAYTPDYTLGVWFGNKNGRPAKALVGAAAAAPVAGEVFEQLYRGRGLPRWPGSEAFELRKLCGKSGLVPSAFCRKKIPEYVVPGIPLITCERCSELHADGVRILSPAPGDYRLPPGTSGAVILPLRANRTGVQWFLNGRAIGADLTEYAFSPDERHTLRAVVDSAPGTPRPAPAEVIFSISGR